MSQERLLRVVVVVGLELSKHEAVGAVCGVQKVDALHVRFTVEVVILGKLKAASDGILVFGCNRSVFKRADLLELLAFDAVLTALIRVGVTRW